MDCLKSQTAVACANTKPGQATRRRRGDLVPVCGWCRKVRNGVGAWVPAEHGLLEDAGQTLTHGVCPDCARDLLRGRSEAA
ncbi:MAG: hypothetical protein U0P46_09470 [Holophagaceae bacterium]